MPITLSQVLQELSRGGCMEKQDKEVRKNKEKVPICEKVTLSMKEAAEYSNIGMNKLYEMTNSPRCPFVLFVGENKRLIKRKAFEKYLETSISI